MTEVEKLHLRIANTKKLNRHTFSISISDAEQLLAEIISLESQKEDPNQVLRVDIIGEQF